MVLTCAAFGNVTHRICSFFRRKESIKLSNSTRTIIEGRPLIFKCSADYFKRMQTRPQNDMKILQKLSSWYITPRPAKEAKLAQA